MIETTPAPPPQCGTNRAVPVDWAILAGLRFLLALIVVGVHLARFANPNSLICRMAHLGGFTAVIGFLVVSGISMAASVERRPQGFLGRRVLRIYPLYLAAVLAPLLLFAAAGATEFRAAPGTDFILPPVPQILGNALLLQGFLFDTVSYNGVLWTLSLEVALYLTVPVLRRLPTAVIVGLGLASAGVFAAHPWTIFLYPSRLTYGAGLAVMAWPWLLGFAWYRLGGTSAASLGLLSVGLVLLEVNQNFNNRLSATCFVAACVLIALSTGVRLPTPVARVLENLGDLSYPLYLFHFPAAAAAYVFLEWRSAIALTAAGLLAAMALHHGLDQPIKWLVRRVPQRRAAARSLGGAPEDAPA